ncbi:hypothetical protein M3E18_06965 [Kocuria sp. p3-SID1433]|uniref:hypothetical protein n=1 Tax=unclassified Kocuria TaxID=2649579 RepID=UPI0021A66291|nr:MULTISPECIES: hypothetical protein [unclassified Kocuria]MCT1602103.1 hypothetical protein [Kocuria sp. p3-SID1428]MCT2180278.1 hypothetical protein [Kocuria sp. p3-SID1433]
MSDGRFAQDSDAAPDDVTIPDPTDPDQQGLNPPAPIIDLGGDIAAGPSRPLGPRRLALLREQMAEHQQEIERSGADDPSHVDPVLAQKQRRMAELASRAAISSEEDRQLADEAIAQTQSIRPITDEYLASLDEQEAHETQPGTSSLEEAPEEVAEQVEQPDRGSDEAPSDPVIQATPWSEPVPVVPASEPADEPARDDLEESSETAQPSDSAEPGEEHVSSLESAQDAEAEETEETSTQASAAQPDAAAETEQAPSEPVRAVNAQGLQLMDPKDYRTPSDWRTPVLTIAAILVLVLLAVLIIFFIL